MRNGMVVLAGAGPGDPRLISVKAMDCIKEADVIVYDRLVDSRLLDAASANAEKIYVGKASSDHTMKQEDINQLLADRALAGKKVLRLKGGDPFVFGRGGEEALHLLAQGVPFEIIPGITSAIAVPAYAGIPVTHRNVAASFAVITGHEDPAKTDSGLRWDKLSTAVDTLVFLMGVENLPYITGELMANGCSADKPAAVIRWGTTAAQETLVTTVGQAVADVAARELKPPAIFIVGEVVRLRESLSWFDRQPLSGKTVLVTRAREQASRLVEELASAGANCVEAPVIKIEEPMDFAPLDWAIEQLSEYQWILFTSPNGVDAFFRRLEKMGWDSRALGGVKTAVIGAQTAEILKKYGIRSDIVPKEFRAEALVEALTGQVLPGDKVLLARAQQARDVLPAELTKMGAAVNVVPVYRTVLGEADGRTVSERLAKGEIDIVTFTSSSTVTFLLDLLGAEGKKLLATVKIASIGPITSDTCRENGIEPDVTAQEYTIPGLVQAIISKYGGGLS